MKAIVQRVISANVMVEEKIIGEIKQGILVLVGFSDNDDRKTFLYMADKLINLRIFDDGQGKMNLSVKDIHGGILIVPNFTLYGDCRKGRRPSFSASSKPDKAKEQYNQFLTLLKEQFPTLQMGEFQAYMKVSLINDGPITLIIDTTKDI